MVRTGFASAARPDQALDPRTTLAGNQPYYFWLEADPLVRMASGGVPAAARLKVALFTFENELEVAPGADVGELELRADGTVRVVRQPGRLPASPPSPNCRAGASTSPFARQRGPGGSACAATSTTSRSWCSPG